MTMHAAQTSAASSNLVDLSDRLPSDDEAASAEALRQALQPVGTNAAPARVSIQSGRAVAVVPAGGTLTTQEEIAQAAAP